MMFAFASGVFDPSSILELPPPSATWQIAQFTSKYVLTRRSQVGVCVHRIGVGRHAAVSFGRALFEDSNMSVGAKLVVRSSACELMLPIHLRRRQAQHKSSRPGMAEHAFIAAGKVPDLLPNTARGTSGL